jgi:hypothetical protein
MKKSIKIIREEIRQRYFKRVEEFLLQVETWLPDDLELCESIPDFTVTDNTGTYHVEMATIYKKDVLRRDGFVADILPFGVTVSSGEGILEISGAFSQETLIYFCQNTVPVVEYQPDIFHIISRSVELDGWYWIDRCTNEDAILVTCERLFDLIDRVNCESFDSKGFEEI